jgi:hypothetical protein
MSNASSGRASLRSSLVASAMITVIGFVAGIAVHFITVFFRDHGPLTGPYTFRGDGAIVFLLLAPICLIVGEIVAWRRRAWLAVALLPVAIVAGLFIFGGV